MSQSQANYWIHHLLPILRQALDSSLDYTTPHWAMYE